MHSGVFSLLAPPQEFMTALALPFYSPVLLAVCIPTARPSNCGCCEALNSNKALFYSSRATFLT